MLDAFTEIVLAFMLYLKENPRVRFVITLIMSFIFVLSLFLYLFGGFLPLHPDLYESLRQLAQPVMIISGFVVSVCLLSFTNFARMHSGRPSELEEIRKEREDLQERIKEKPKAYVLDTIHLSLNQISEYYTINKNQARNSFRFSVFCVIVGLAVIVGGVYIFYLGANKDVTLTAISGIGGVMMELIGAASFFLYNKSIAQLNYFYGMLNRMQDMMLAFKMTEQISDAKKQSIIRERLIEELVRFRSFEYQPTPISREKKDALTTSSARMAPAGQ